MTTNERPEPQHEPLSALPDSTGDSAGHRPPAEPDCEAPTDPRLVRLAQRGEQVGHEFLADFLEAAVLRHPENTEAWADLGQVLTRLGRHQRALEVDRELVRQMPDNPIGHYNLACSLAHLGQAAEALCALQAACRLGYDDPVHLLADEDLASLRTLPEFRNLVRRLQA